MGFFVIIIFIFILFIAMKNLSNKENTGKSNFRDTILYILLFFTFLIIYYFLIAMVSAIILKLLGFEYEIYYSLILGLGLSPIAAFITNLKFYRLKDFKDE